MVIGVPEGTSTPLPAPTVATTAPIVRGAQVSRGPAPPVEAPSGPTGQPWPEPIPFASTIAIPDHLVFVLVIGSDARPGQDPASARGDSLHLLAVNPQSRQATIVGFPRDSWVEVPGRGHQKINAALALGGPDLMAQTVRHLTGLPIHYYVLTGFEGFERIVDELAGLDIPVPHRMNDRASGARFEAGWNRLGGQGALAFARNRHDTPNGDFSRSGNQGLVILSALAKMRGEVGDDAGVLRWIDVLLRHTRLDVALSDLPRLGALARVLDPARVQNVVVPGAAGRAGRASVVRLDPAGANALFNDLRDDAVMGTAEPPAPPAQPPPPAGPDGPGTPDTTTPP